MTEREQWFCTNCGALFFVEEKPLSCTACNKITEEMSKTAHPDEYTEFERVVEARELDGEIPEETEECPGCGEQVHPDEITHALGGGYCPNCS